MAQRVKAIEGEEGGAWELDVLGCPFGGPNAGRDADGEFFSPETKFHADKYPLPPVVYYHGYEPEGGRPAGAPQYIGRTIAREEKADGVWYRVVLDKSSAFAQRVWEAAKNGIARASSGSSHLSRVASSGHIAEWPVVELSLFDAVGKRKPANAYAVALPVAKAVYAEAGIPLPLDFAEPEADAGEPLGGSGADGAVLPLSNHPASPLQGGGHPPMTEEEVKAAIEAALKAEREAVASAAEAKAAEESRIADAVKAERTRWEADAAASNRLADGAPAIAKFGFTRKYDNLEPGDHAVMVGLLMDAKSRARSKYGASDEAVKALAIKLAEDTSAEHAGARSAMKMAGVPAKANELNQSTLSSYGDEWIGVAYSNVLWEKIRLGTPVAGLLPTIEIPQGVESVIIPLEGTAPTFYKVAQASAQDTNTLGKATYTHTSSKAGTANKTITAAKLGARVIFTSELEEDSIIPWVAELRRQFEKEAAEVLEHLIIDGDTDASATTNINSIGGTPAATDAYLLFNGLRKLALVTNTANSRSCGATLGVESYLETLKLMGLGGGMAANRDDSVFLVDMHTYWATLKLAEVKTQDVFAAPTLSNGALTGLWGRRLIATPNMHRANQDATYGLKANSAGKVDLTTPANNTLGAIVAFIPSQWRLGWKRRIRFEIDRIPQADASEIIVNMRVGLINRDNEASAITYNVPLT